MPIIDSHIDLNNGKNNDSYINYLAKKIDGKVSTPYRIDINNEYLEGRTYVYDDANNFKATAHFHQHFKDFTIDLQKSEDYDYLITCFSNHVGIFNEGNETIINIPKGFFVLKKNEVIRLHEKQGDYKMNIAFHLKKEDLRDDLVQKLDTIDSFIYHTGNNLTTEFLRSVSIGIINYILPEYKEEWIRMRLNTLLLMVKNTLHEYTPNDNKSFFLDYEINAAHTIKERILNDLRQKPSLKKLATEFGINTNKLTSVYKNLYGLTIYKYYTEQRLLKVKEEIITTNKSFTEIAYEFNFTDINHFSKSVIEYFKLKPSDLRKMQK
ncbi:AraC family transcriptional regulator [Flammeovirga sp. SubArs3]|uniref:helix-turn-helix domain-containing protein n=1 Tax=Flammeovirga sp. SubArs3 TaxID=2995316 RepID=UPI00248B7DE0|nr:AraC family transcriptional regulator [Flammeovirga sp. SubArs3]